MNRYLPASLICLAQLLCYSPVLAEPDDLQQAWLDQVDVAAGWDVAERIDGTKPTRVLAGLRHSYHMTAGDSVTVKVPAGERLAVYRLNGAISPREIEFTWSNGTGLFAPLSSVPAGDKRSLITAPPTGGITLIRVHRKQATEGAFELALFTSRDANRLKSVSYREILAPMPSAPKVRLEDGSGKTNYWHSDVDTPLQLDLNQATRIRIDSRLLFPRHGGPLSDGYRIYASLDDQPWQVFDLVTLLDTTAAITVDGRSQPVGRTAYAYLDVPDGHHRLELRMHRPILIRLLARQQPDDYLYPGNRPNDYENTVGGVSKNVQSPYFWNLTDNESGGNASVKTSADEIQNDLSHPDSATYLNAARVAQDNVHPLGGISAIRPLMQWAGRYPGQPDYQSMEARRRLQHTFYRNLMPQQGNGNTDTVFAWFHTPRLRVNPEPVYFLPAYAESLAGGLASGYFTTIPFAPQGGRGAQEFLLPERTQPQQLRISIDRTGLSSEVTFYLQLDDTEPLRLSAKPHRVISTTKSRPNAGAIALELLQQQHGSAAGTLSGGFAVRRTAAPLVDAGFLELLLEKPVHKVKVWRQDAGIQSLQIALAYRTSSWYQMSESGYLDLLNAAEPETAQKLFQTKLSALRRISSQSVSSTQRTAAMSYRQDIDRDLHNQWKPLLRFLSARYSLFTSEIAATGSITNPAPAMEVEPMVHRAKAAEQSAEWLVALEKWSQVQRTSEGQLRAHARSRQILALQLLGNGFLAKQLLRHDFLYAGDSMLSRQALKHLLQLAEQQGDAESVLTLRAVAAIQDPVAENLRHLAVSLLDTNRSHFAMYILLAMPKDQRPATSALAVAYDLGWWQWFEQTLSTSSDQQLNALWRGYRAQRNGDYQGALDFWKSSGQDRENPSQHLLNGIDIRRGLQSSEHDVRRRSVIAWEKWQQAMPGPRRWQEIPNSVIGHDGAPSVYSITQGQFFDRFKASPKKPVTVSVYGPMELRLEVRPLHESATDGLINDWATILSGGVEERYPIIDNRVSSGLRLVAESPGYPGQRLEIVKQIPAGYHELQISAQQSAVLIGIAALRPRLPLAILPPLNPFTARAIPANGQYSRTPLAESRDTESVTVHTAAPPSVRTRLINRLWQAEQIPGQYMNAMTQAETRAHGRLEIVGVEQILRRLRRQTSWQRVRSAQDSAGVRLIDFTGWQPEAPEIRTRKAIMGLNTDDAQVLSGDGTRVLSMYNLQPVKLAVELSIHDAAKQPVQAMDALISWDDSPEQLVHLSARNPGSTLSKNIGPGNHVVRIRLADPVANQFLRIRFTEQRGRKTSVAATPVQRSYMVATKRQPLVLLLQGPTRLRIDEWRDGDTRVTYRTVASGWQEVTIPVESDRDEALFRVFQRVPERDKPVTPSRVTNHLIQPVAEPRWQPNQSDPVAGQFRSEPLSNELLDGTWSLMTGAVSRRIVDDEPIESRDAEKYITIGGAYRKFDALPDSAFYADGRLRVRQQGSPTLATRSSLTVRRPNWPLDLDLSGHLFAQRVDVTGKAEAAATVRARISRSRYFGEKLSHRPSVSVFQRWLSLDELAAPDAEQVDQDIFTRYKRDHRRGLRFGDRIQYRPWLDTVLSAGAYVASNENLNPFDPDHLGLTLSIRQLIGDVDLGLRYSRFEYFRDSNRDRASDAQRVRADVGFTRWLSSRYGLQANLGIEYDQNSAESSVFLSLSLQRSKGRYFRDFTSGELDFKSLRQRRLLERRAITGME